MKIFISFLLILISCLCEILFLRQRGRGNHRSALLMKGLASLCFCLLGLYAAQSRRTGFGYLVVSGLALGLLGDLLLGMRKLSRRGELFFILGALAFCLGHGAYILALSSLASGIFLPALPIFLILTAGSEVFARYGGFHRGKMHLPGIFYIAVEAFMCGCALSLLYISPGICPLLFSLGGLSFLVSDNLLCAFSFGRLHTAAVDRLLHGTYLAAQLLIGLSIWYG